jgi:hypothetical protein
MIVENRLVIEGGWLEGEEAKGTRTFNLYLPPKPIDGDPTQADLWRQHGAKLWGDDCQHIEQWLAWKVQRPDIKINHGLVLGSEWHGIGKDTYLAPVKVAVGPWNFTDISARQALDVEHNRFLRSTILRINEAHDLGEKRFQFYDQTKDWFASPPETLRIADKWLGAHPIFNLVGVIISTNHLSDGIRTASICLPKIVATMWHGPNESPTTSRRAIGETFGTTTRPAACNMRRHIWRRST